MKFKKENPFLFVFDINCSTQNSKWKLNDNTIQYLGDMEYEFHKKAQTKKIKKHKEHDVWYTLNKFGYRTKYDYPPNRDYILVFGCSYSYGHSIPEEFRYSNRLEKYLGLPVVNISISGASSNLMKDNLLQLLISGHRLPSVIIAQWPYSERYWIGQTPLHYDKRLSVGLNSLIDASEHAFETFNYLCQMHDINLLNLKVHKDANDFDIPYMFDTRDDFLDRGRDDFHPGTKTHKHIAHKILKLLEDKNLYRSNT